ncbi:cobalamin synthesis protein P47K [Tissierella creatinini]|nr:cobalamin synthesis protein P47K [Tissierella creatinini]TJX62814.1 cobalamin synthesis protein P47K [Soehngenia saccharolytica]
MKTRIIMVGGFLGAGKTTLLYKIAHEYALQGIKVGLITNDQAAGLVDTAYLERTGSVVSEVNGSCFCCNFKGLTDAIGYIQSQGQIEIIIAEPVGSCTDLSATLIQPLKDHFRDSIIVSPLSVLIDPKRLESILGGGTSGLHSSAAYIVRKQLEEADIIVINKADLLSEGEASSLKKQAELEWPDASVFLLSGKSGLGLDDWLSRVLVDNYAGGRILEIDYDVYAEGEAVLGWLNRTSVLGSEKADWNDFADRLLHSLAGKFDKEKAAVGHVKLFLEKEDENDYLIGNMTGGEDTISRRGSLKNAGTVKMTLNARVQMDPDKLEGLVNEEISRICGDDILELLQESRCLSPGRPNPTYRYNEVMMSPTSSSGGDILVNKGGVS